MSLCHTLSLSRLRRPSTVKETTAAVSVLEDSVENTRSELQSVTTALQKSRNAVQALNEVQHATYLENK